MIENQPPEATRIIVFTNLLKERMERISFFIGQDMSMPFVTKSQTQSHIQQLIKLGLSEKAREIFLGSRERVIQELLR